VSSRGFTLVEVMVALAVVAIALPAVLMALYQQTDDTAYLRDKSLAQMIAASKLDEMRLVIAASRNLSTGKDSGQARVADRDWYWWVETKTTEVPQYYRIEIRVALDEKRREQPLYTLNAFMSGDLRIDPEGLQQENDTPVPDDPPSEPDIPQDQDQSRQPSIPTGELPEGLNLELPQ